MENAYKNHDSDDYDDDFEQSPDASLIASKRMAKSKATNKSTTFLANKTRNKKDLYNNMAEQRSVGALSSAHGNITINSGKDTGMNFAPSSSVTAHNVCCSDEVRVHLQPKAVQP